MRKRQKLYKAIITKGKFAGEVGRATAVNIVGNVMFYPDSEVCYCICKPYNEIEYKE